MKNLILSSRKSFLARILTRLASEKIKKYFSGIIQYDYSNSLGDTNHSKKAWENHGFGIFTNTLSKKLINNYLKNRPKNTWIIITKKEC